MQTTWPPRNRLSPSRSALPCRRVTREPRQPAAERDQEGSGDPSTLHAVRARGDRVGARDHRLLVRPVDARQRRGGTDRRPEPAEPDDPAGDRRTAAVRAAPDGGAATAGPALVRV